MVVETTRYGTGDGGTRSVRDERRRHQERLHAWSPSDLEEVARIRRRTDDPG